MSESANPLENVAYDDEPRQIVLTLRRIDPWTVLKQTFLLSVGLGIAMIGAVVLVWLLLDLVHVWSSLETAMAQIDESGPFSQLLGYLRLPRVTAMATVFAVINTVLFTVLITLGAILYNLFARLVGGIRVTLSDE